MSKLANKLNKMKKLSDNEADDKLDEIYQNEQALIISKSEKIKLRNDDRESRRKAATQTMKDYNDGLIEACDEDAIYETHQAMLNGTYDRQKLKLEKAKRDRHYIEFGQSDSSESDTSDIDELLDLLS